jgi:hypothetical protein
MRAETFVVCGLLVGALAGAAAGQEAKPAVSAEARVAWLTDHLAPLRSLDPADENFADLEPIRKAVINGCKQLTKPARIGRGSSPRPRTAGMRCRR